MSRFLLMLAAILVLGACASKEAAPAPPTPPSPAVATPFAMEMKATLYDDGLACPGGCDAHVVFHPSHNGTSNAYAPASSRNAPQKCVNGEACVICFSAAPESCMTARYRGAGPARGRFDMTPALFQARCAEAGLPLAFASECRRLETAAASLGYDRRVNCVARPSEPRCTLLLGPKREAARKDTAERDKCLALGEAAYNRQQTDASLHRALGCNYFVNQRGRNSAGETWMKLAPGSCRPETFVGRDGLDCCSASLYAAAALHPECRGFFLDRL